MARRIWAGLDVGVETTSVCIIDDAGDVLHEGTCPSALMVAMWKKGEDYQPNYPGRGDISEPAAGRIGPRKAPGVPQRAFCLGAGPCRAGEEAVERQAGAVSALS